MKDTVSIGGGMKDSRIEHVLLEISRCTNACDMVELVMLAYQLLRNWWRYVIAMGWFTTRGADCGGVNSVML